MADSFGNDQATRIPKNRQADRGCRLLDTFANVDALPAHTFLFISALAWPGMLVEVDLIAAISD